MYGPCISMTWIKKRQTQRQNGFSKLTLLSLLKVMCVIFGIKIAESCHIRYGRILLRACTVRTSVSCYFRNVQIVRRANYTSSLVCGHICPFVCQAFCLGRHEWKWDWSWPCFDHSFLLRYVNDVLLMSFFTLVLACVAGVRLLWSQRFFLKIFFGKERELRKNRKEVCIKMRSTSAHIHSKDRTLSVCPPL